MKPEAFLTEVDSVLSTRHT